MGSEVGREVGAGGGGEGGGLKRVGKHWCVVAGWDGGLAAPLLPIRVLWLMVGLGEGWLGNRGKGAVAVWGMCVVV